MQGKTTPIMWLWVEHIAAITQVHLLALAPGQRPADYFLMTKWNITAEDNIWVYIPPAGTHTPVCIHEHAYKRSHALLQRVVSHALAPILTCCCNAPQRSSDLNTFDSHLKCSNTDLRPRRVLSLKGGCWPTGRPLWWLSSQEQQLCEDAKRWPSVAAAAICWICLRWHFWQQFLLMAAWFHEENGADLLECTVFTCHSVSPATGKLKRS